MNRAFVLLGAVLVFTACDRGEGDAPTDDVARDLELAAPLAFELADGQLLRIHEAELADGRVGLLELHGDAIDVTRGRVALARTADDGRLVVEQADGTLRNAASERNDHDEHEVFDAQLEGIELAGFDRAVFLGPRGTEDLRGPIVIDAIGLAWTGAELRVVAGERDESSSASERGARSRGGSHAAFARPARVPGAGVPMILDTAHADASDPSGAGWFTDDDEPFTAPGDICTSTSTCDMGTVCVADTSTSDGSFRCLAECVPPAPQVGGSPLPESASAVCVDDEGCCDPARECSNGECVVPTTSGGGSGPSNDVDPDAAGGCDPDGDNVISACDAKPNESCTADADGDGCANSFDDNDQNSCQCSARIPKPNSFAILMLALAFGRGRQRRAMDRAHADARAH